MDNGCLDVSKCFRITPKNLFIGDRDVENEEGFASIFGCLFLVQIFFFKLNKETIKKSRYTK